jgi:hypothetical protein
MLVDSGTKGQRQLRIPVGSCHATEEMFVEVGSSDPHIHVMSASYGHPYDVSKVVDLKDKMLRRIKRTREGYMLDITTTDDLDKEFGIPVDDVYKVGGCVCTRTPLFVAH